MTSAIAVLAGVPEASNSSQSHASASSKHGAVPLWNIFELALPGPESGNPFLDVELGAVFTLGHRSVDVDGFYDGAGQYKVRFMPDTEGEWSYRTRSNQPILAGKTGTFTAVKAEVGAHGLVGVHNTTHFAFSDGTPFFPFGTTCYAWIHQDEELQRQTLDTLSKAPFNKLRMCVFPKHYEYNHNEPPLYPFERDNAGKSDWTRPNPAFYRHLEERITDLRKLEIEADLILFHPYDRWGYASMPPDADDRYLKYVLARLAAHRNIWWSLANEYDLMKEKTTQDFDRFFRIVQEKDPYGHLRSIHYSITMYDNAKTWVTHASMQTAMFDQAGTLLSTWKKPICYDEVMYEGNLNRRWGNLAGDELTRRFWLGVIAGCYVTHGETYLEDANTFDESKTPTIWWSHGGQLHGSSPAQIGFLRKLVEQTYTPGPEQSSAHSGLEADPKPYYLNASAYNATGKKVSQILYYFDFHQPVWYEFPLPEGSFTAEYIDPIAMTRTPVAGTHSGKAKIKLADKPYQAVLFRNV